MYITSTFAMIIHGNFWGHFSTWRFTKTSKVHIVEVHGIWSSSSGRPTFSNASCIPKVPTRPGQGGGWKILFGGSFRKKYGCWDFFWDVVVVVDPPHVFFWNQSNHWRKIATHQSQDKNLLQLYPGRFAMQRIPAREPAAHRLSSWSLVVTGIALEGVAAWVSPTKPVDLTAKCPWWWRTMIRSPHADIGRLTRALPKHIREMCGCNLVSLSVCSSVISGSHSMSVM